MIMMGNCYNIDGKQYVPVQYLLGLLPVSVDMVVWGSTKTRVHVVTQ